MGGSSPKTTTTTVDPVYNAGMLELSKEQQGWAAEMFNQFKYGVKYDPNEVQKGAYIDGKWTAEADLPDTSQYKQLNPDWIAWNKQKEQSNTNPALKALNPTLRATEIGPEPEKFINSGNQLQERTLGEINQYDPNAHVSEMDYLQQVVDANAGILGLQTDVTKAQLEGQKRLIPQRTALASGLITDANKGINVNSRMNEAQAQVQHGFKNANESAIKNIQSYGLDPSSGMFTTQNRDIALAEATGIAGARTAAKNLAENEQFQRKTQALQLTA